jgi:hypothetical protein
MATKILTQDIVRKLLDYSPDTGVFTHTKSRAGVTANSRAGTTHHLGYRTITILGKGYAEHRIAWLYVYGCWPAADLDHINRVRSDNRLCNLREATRAQNCQNQPISGSNKSGVTGVHVHKITGKWAVSISIEGKQKHLGLFVSLEDATQARKLAELRHYPYGTTN